MKKFISLLLAAVSLVSCGNNQGNSSDYEDSSEEEYIGNPYDPDSGHGAGYDWAEQTGGDCNGNSDSFNEGCEEYYRQIGQ